MPRRKKYSADSESSPESSATKWRKGEQGSQLEAYKKSNSNGPTMNQSADEKPCTLAQLKDLFEAQAQKIEESETRIKTAMSTRFEELEQKIKEVQEENSELKRENELVKNRVLQLERESKRCNFVATGLDFVHARDGYEALNRVIGQATEGRVKVTCVRTIPTRGQGNKIVAKCRSEEEKRILMANRKNMAISDGNTRTPIYLDDDLTKEDQEIHARLRAEARKAKAEGKETRLSRNRLKISNTWYYVNPRTKELDTCTFQGQVQDPLLEYTRTTKEAPGNK